MSDDGEYDEGYEYDPDVDKIEPSMPPKPFIEIFSTHPDAFNGYFDKRRVQEYPDIEDEDSIYESMGATITQTDTFYPSSNRTITRKKT
jgi:hypothetical protein